MVKRQDAGGHDQPRARPAGRAAALAARPARDGVGGPRTGLGRRRRTVPPQRAGRGSASVLTSSHQPRVARSKLSTGTRSFSPWANWSLSFMNRSVTP